MSTASLRRHFYGLVLPVHVLVILKNHGIDRTKLATMSIDELVKLGIDQDQARTAVATARKQAPQ